jgi:hypothetical protein
MHQIGDHGMLGGAQIRGAVHGATRSVVVMALPMPAAGLVCNIAVGDHRAVVLKNQ